MVAAGILALLIVVGALTDDKKGNSDSASSTDTPAAATTKQAEVDVTRPSDGATIHRARFTMVGTSTPGTAVEVDSKVAQTAADGTWTAKVDAPVGKNVYTVTASGAGYETATYHAAVTRKRTAAQRAALRARQAKAAAKAKAEEAARAQRAAAAKAARVANYKASAKSIPYKQLDKNSDPYVGTRVMFRGKILQIQEDSGGGFMLLSVTDQGYDIWTDNVWVNYDHPISSAEDDIVTVWGTITGTKSYDTQIGGSTYVPEMHARYISPG